MAMGSPAAAVLVVAFCCCCFSFVSSGILPGPVRGYQSTFSSRSSQSYDSDTGAFRAVTVTSRQCSVIRRMTQYETVRLPFLCQAVTGRVAPLPPRMDSNRVQILNAMQAGGWSVCYQPITVPIYRYQRIPVCCPGTTPTPDGSCLCKKDGSPMPDLPTPGQLLQSSVYNGLQDSPHPGYQHIPDTPTPIMVQPPRPYRGILSNVAPSGLKSNSLLHQVTLSGGVQNGPVYTIDNHRPRPRPLHHQGGRPVPPSYRLPPRTPTSPVVGGSGVGGGVTEWQSEIARYLAAMMYQKLLVEQQQKILQDEIGRQLRLRQQMEFIIAQQRRLAQLQQQRQQQRQQQQQPGGSYPSFNHHHLPPVPQPRPIPSPPIKTTGIPSGFSFHNQQGTPGQVDPGLMNVGGGGGGGGQEEVVVGEGEGEGDGPGPAWAGGILDDMSQQPQQNGTTEGLGSSPGSNPPMYGNRPTNIPPAGAQVPAEWEIKEMVKGIVDDCLRSSGVEVNLQDVVMSRDPSRLAPICRASNSVGPCVMQQVGATFGEDPAGLMGRQMTRSLLMILGHTCMQLHKAETKSHGSDDVTSAPVFPNPAPSVTATVVTEGTVESTSEGDIPAVTESSSSNNNNKEPGIHSARESPQTEPQPPAVTLTNELGQEAQVVASGPPLDTPVDTPDTSAQQQKQQQQPNAQKRKSGTKAEVLAEAAFPMWMILAMVGACAALLFFTCLTICLVLRCRRKKKTVELDREPEKLPVPAEPNHYAASPFQPPPAYPTTPVKQTLGGQEEDKEEEEEMEDTEFKIPEDTDSKEEEDVAAEKAMVAVAAAAPESEECCAEDEGKEGKVEA